MVSYYICNRMVSKSTRRDVFQALADPTRRAILLLLVSKTMTPNALAENFQVTRQAVSKHLRILSECQLIKAQPEGREIHYKATPDCLNDLEHWLSEFKLLWAKRFEVLDEILNTPKSN